MIILTRPEWHRILEKIKQEHPPSTYLISGKMRERLGFTVREHKSWIDTTPTELVGTGYNTGHYAKTQICLDFYNDASESWFRLKYLNRE